MGSPSPPEPIESLGKFDFRISKIDDAGYASTLESIRARYRPLYDTRFEAQGYVKTADDYFRVVFVSSGGEISGLYERRGVSMFGIRVENRGTPQPFEILQGIDFNLPNVDFKRVDGRVDYYWLRDPGAASYTLRDLANAVNTLLLGFKKAGTQWVPAMTTLIGATSEACKSIAMERHVAVGLNIITRNVLHTPSKRIVKIMKSWSKISKSIKTDKYDYELKYNNENGIEVIERVTKYSAGQILALINSKDGSKEEKQTRKQGKEEKRKRKRDDFEERGEGSNKGNLKNLKAQKSEDSEMMAALKNPEIIASVQKNQSSLNDSPDETMIGLLEQTIDDTAKVEDKEPEEFQKVAESEDDISDFDYSKAPELFNVHMTPHGVYTSSDSDLDSEAEDDKTPVSEDERTPADDKAPELFNVRMTPHGVYTSSDSDSDFEAEDDKTPVSEDEKTPTPVFLVEDKEPKEIQKAAESEDDISDFHYYKAPEVFNVHMTPHGVYTSSDSDLDSEAEDDKTPEDEKTPADDKAPELFNPHMTPHGVYTSSDSDSEAEDDKTPEDEKTPADDKAPELFSPHMTPHGVYTSSDSDSEAEDDKTPEDEKTPADEKAPELFSPHMTPHGVYTSSDSDSEAEDDKTPEDEKTPDDKAPELFSPHMTPHGVYTSSDSDSEAEDDKTPEDEKTPADDKAPELFSPHMTPHGVYTSSDSDSEAEDDKTPVSEDAKCYYLF